MVEEEEEEEWEWGKGMRKMVVIGHRGNGMNMLQSSDSRMKFIKQNSILSFNSAAKFPIDFVEFDVQVCFIFPRLTQSGRVFGFWLRL